MVPIHVMVEETTFMILNSYNFEIDFLGASHEDFLWKEGFS